MRVIVDVLGAPQNSGGMQLFAKQMITSWKDRTDNDDQLVVVGGQWIVDAFAELDYVETRPIRTGSAMRRCIGQIVVVAYLFWIKRGDAVISVSPVVTPLVPRDRRSCVVHDWRHLS